MSRKNTVRRRRPRYALPRDTGKSPTITIYQLIGVWSTSVVIAQVIADIARSIGRGL